MDFGDDDENSRPSALADNRGCQCRENSANRSENKPFPMLGLFGPADIPPEPDPRRDDWLEFGYFASDKELEDCWRQDGERAIREWLKTNAAGTRPANYWNHALPYAGERRYGADLVSPFLDDETDAEYLKRHSLLLKGERI